MRKTHRKIISVSGLDTVVKNFHKLRQHSLQFSLQILICLRSYIKNSKQFFTTVSKHIEVVKNSAYGLVFQHTSRCFDTVVKNAFSFCIYYIYIYSFQKTFIKTLQYGFYSFLNTSLLPRILYPICACLCEESIFLLIYSCPAWSAVIQVFGVLPHNVINRNYLLYSRTDNF